MIYDGLDAAFREHLTALETRCAEAGVTLRPYFGVRDPVTQAKLWRRSRPGWQIAQAHAQLVAAKAPFLADCLDKAGPQPTGPWATNALPGMSWHQWGEAMDYMWIVDGKPCWTVSKTDPANGYMVLARCAESLGLTSGVHFGDNDHVQLRPFGSPKEAGLTTAQIDAAMKARWAE